MNKSERLSAIEGRPPFVFPSPSNPEYKNVPIVSLVNHLNPRTTEVSDRWSKIGDTKIYHDHKLTKARVKDIILTLRPELVGFIDPFDNGKCPNVMSQVSRRRRDGKSVPGIVAIMTHEPPEQFKNAHKIEEHANFLPENMRPGHLFTVRRDIDIVIVSSEELKVIWEEHLPEKKVVAIDPREKDAEEKLLQVLKELVDTHNYSDVDWEKKKGRGLGGVIFDRWFRREI